MLKRNESFTEGPNNALWRVTQRVEYPNKQIAKIDGRNKLVEFMSNSFNIGRLYINMIEYNVNAEKGSRQKKRLDYYLKFEDLLFLCDEIRNNNFAKKVKAELTKEAEAKAKGESYYTKDLYVFKGGVSVQKLAARNASRADGKPMARTIRFRTSSMAGCACSIQIERGPGKMNEATGGVVPDYAGVKALNTPDDGYLIIPISKDDFKPLFFLLEAHIKAYINAQYALIASSQEANYLFEGIVERSEQDRIYMKKTYEGIRNILKAVGSISQLPEKIMSKLKTDVMVDETEMPKPKPVPQKETKQDIIEKIENENSDDDNPSIVDDITGEIISDDLDKLYDGDIPF